MRSDKASSYMYLPDGKSVSTKTPGLRRHVLFGYEGHMVLGSVSGTVVVEDCQVRIYDADILQ